MRRNRIWLCAEASCDARGKQTSCVAALVDITRRKHAEEELRLSSENFEARVQQRTQELDAANRNLQAEAEDRKRMEASRAEMMRALSAAQEEERGRISRELHDEIGQHITALLLGLKSLEKELPPKSARMTTVQSLQAITENVGHDIHEMAPQLRPTALDDLGLGRALSTFLEDWAARS
jgi:signal transduction histidine kinase